MWISLSAVRKRAGWYARDDHDKCKSGCWKANATAKMPRFYWDLAKAKASLEKGETPWTPAVSIVYGFAVSLDMILKEGLPNVFARHAP